MHASRMAGLYVSALLLTAGCAGDDEGTSDEVAESSSSETSEAESETSSESESETDSEAESETSSESESETDSGSDTDAGSIWQPSPGTSWQWQLSGELDAEVDVAMIDIDLFDTPSETIATLAAGGKVVVCYFSAGSHEDWRPDADAFPDSAIGEPLEGWPGERWLDIRDAEVRAIMQARLELAASKGCVGVEPDNVDGYANASGFDLSAADQLDYNRFLATQAHALGLSIGLKNDLEQVDALLDDFDWALNEECLAYAECELLEPFLAAGKAVFHVEYVDAPEQGPALAGSVCPAVPPGFSTLIKTWDLDAWRLACP